MNARRIARRRALALLAAGIAPAVTRAQGFAGLGAPAPGFLLPDPATRLRFPDDHGPHGGFRIEWWYVTALLLGREDGLRYGAQWTLFRTALEPASGDGLDDNQLWMGHAAVTTSGAHHFAERLGRGGTGQAGVIQPPFMAWIDEWGLTSRAPAGRDPLDRVEMTARGRDFAYTLDLEAEGPLVLHGRDGYSVKAASGAASHYYSQPFYRVTGDLRLPSGLVAVSGSAWLDREWSSQPLADDQDGWDWLSLRFEDGHRLMAFRLRSSGGDFVSGTAIAPDGTTRALGGGDLRLTPVETEEAAGRRLPLRWRVEVPADGRDVEVAALFAGAFNDATVPYWEGPVFGDGVEGYLELTGY
jgi:predicted secreted hydrolase